MLSLFLKQIIVFHNRKCKIKQIILPCSFLPPHTQAEIFPLFHYYPLPFCQAFLPLISAPTGFLDWGLVTRWAKLLLTLLSATYPAHQKIKVRWYPSRDKHLGTAGIEPGSSRCANNRSNHWTVALREFFFFDVQSLFLFNWTENRKCVFLSASTVTAFWSNYWDAARSLLCLRERW